MKRPTDACLCCHNGQKTQCPSPMSTRMLCLPLAYPHAFPLPCPAFPWLAQPSRSLPCCLCKRPLPPAGLDVIRRPINDLMKGRCVTDARAPLIVSKCFWLYERAQGSKWPQCVNSSWEFTLFIHMPLKLSLPGYGQVCYEYDI